MNVFQKAVRAKLKKSGDLTRAHSNVSEEISRLIQIEPYCGLYYGFDQVEGYTFHNSPQRNSIGRKWIVNKILPNKNKHSEELWFEELDYTDPDETAKFFKALENTLSISAE